MSTKIVATSFERRGVIILWRTSVPELNFLYSNPRSASTAGMAQVGIRLGRLGLEAMSLELGGPPDGKLWLPLMSKLEET